MTLLEALILIPLGAAAGAPWLEARLKDQAYWVMASLAALLFAALLGAGLGGWLGAESSRPWAPELGVSLDLRATGLGWAMALLITGIGALVLLYSRPIMGSDPKSGRFLSTLMAFMGAMLGVVMSDNVLLLFVFWELTSITSFLLIGFKSDKKESRDAALQALFITGGGGLVLLAGLVWLGMEAGTYAISDMAAVSNPWIVLLVAIGAFTKSAQFPFHFWLPGAMAAPTPVSAYLHSATMVKAGVFLLAALHPVLGGSALWLPLVGGVGAATAVAGSVLAFVSSDLKRILAWSTVAALGSLTCLVGLGTEKSMQAFAIFLLAHACYKGALFMSAGILEKKAGSRDVSQLSGLRTKMPLTFAAAALAGLSMMGVLPLAGFVAKEYFFEAALALTGPLMPWIAAAAFIGAAGGVFAALQAGFSPFLGNPGPELDAKEPGWELLAGPAVLSLLGLAAGAGLSAVNYGWVGPVASTALGSPVDGSLKLWAGLTPALGLSVAAIALGLGCFAGWKKAWPALAGVETNWKYGPAEAFRRFSEWLPEGCAAAGRLMDHGRLRWDFILFFGAALVLVGLWLVRLPLLPPEIKTLELAWHEIMVLAGGAAGAVTAVFSKSRLGAIALLGALGFAIASTYLFLGAPDLAVTQILVEALAVVLLVLVFAKLPGFRKLTTKTNRLRDAVLAGGVGLCFSLLMLHIAALPAPNPVSQRHAELSVEGAKGANVVNTILVDFRALDTLGEITVLAVAALGVFALVSMRKKLKAATDAGPGTEGGE